ncbi:MAG TPA: CinA family nicotinamide mononucleotide deamidase-related protein [Chitinophagaceae bacterium]|nr:CinA family nicotinamide mononucleotide deamidase-related protein [Chitinophagaceae bacterium]HMZ46769.1 CinA family nicotinamide mononucleotide deamidase-related protein [Chitinophagaceae bacterium]HNF30100.1 CinA family nicotinamide mononucleotide deamidase-related protein [Chitinophagaceae bacterium]HNJ58544.1 CinA family nicotinamide mononucleotide deamidase-related protein [Chitinophagaceae bacterium]HNM35071.1 CinA family nicotinamide mononucleotide deamidase-related protein [Chitinoph
MNKIFATIITIGDELLIGQVIDTNSAFIAQELNKIGISVKQRVSIADEEEAIFTALDNAFIHSNIILITGGLGPTSDDITKPTLCKYFGGKMTMHQPTLQHVTYLFEQVFKRPMIERNVQQAMVPDVCTVLKNEVGTAPAMLFKKNNTICIAMPGVPFEMKWIMQHHVLDIIPQQFKTGIILHKTLLTAGIGESFLAELIQDWENKLPTDIKLAYLPKFGMVRLRLTGLGLNKELLAEKMQTEFEKLKTIVQEFLVIDEDLSLEVVVSNLLKQYHQTVAIAESCTGGAIASSITALPGASSVFKGGIVCYSNYAKNKLLHVPNEILNTVGAVSKETVEILATNILKNHNSHYALAVSGIMGPTGATETKPIGLVWIAVVSEKNLITKQFNFKYDRERNIQHTTVNALNMLRKLIIEENKNS